MAKKRREDTKEFHIFPSNPTDQETVPYLDFGLDLVVSFPGDLEVSLLHVCRRLGVERVGDRAEDEHVELDALLALHFLALLLLLQKQHVRKTKVEILDSFFASSLHKKQTLCVTTIMAFFQDLLLDFEISQKLFRAYSTQQKKMYI